MDTFETDSGGATVAGCSQFYGDKKMYENVLFCPLHECLHFHNLESVVTLGKHGNERDLRWLVGSIATVKFIYFVAPADLADVQGAANGEDAVFGKGIRHLQVTQLVLHF